MKGLVNSDEESFYKLLGWLDPDPERAGAQYETIRKGLIRILAGKRCHIPEELADEVIERVTKNIDYLLTEYEGKQHHYFYAVARNVFLEYSRRPKSEVISALFPASGDDNSSAPEINGDELECIRQCLELMEDDDRNLVFNYYRGIPSNLFDLRQALSSELGLTINHLRVRAHRVRSRLRRCYRQCRKRK